MGCFVFHRWSLIAGRLPGRTDNEVKNYWNSHIRKKLIKMGIDPNNHRLNHIPRPQRPQRDDFSSNVTSKNEACKTKVTSGGNNDRVSDAGSCLEDETSGDSTLNLDLTISVPSLSSTLVDEDNNKPQNSLSLVPGAVGSDELPTLLLFR